MSPNPHRTVTVAALAVLATWIARDVLADTPTMKLPSGCDRGDVVIATSSTTFECVAPQELLRVQGCSDDDFVKVDSSGVLECVSPSSTPWGIEGLLPDCSSGATLVSEGFGRWKCVEGK